MLSEHSCLKIEVKSNSGKHTTLATQNHTLFCLSHTNKKLIWCETSNILSLLWWQSGKFYGIFRDALVEVVL